MSVRLADRSPSKMEFLDSTYNLEKQILFYVGTKNFIPKGHRGIYINYLLDSVRHINKCVIYANSIFVIVSTELDIDKLNEQLTQLNKRLGYQNQAILEVENLIQIFRVVFNSFTVNDNVQETLSEQALKTEKAIKAWNKYDISRKDKLQKIIKSKQGI